MLCDSNAAKSKCRLLTTLAIKGVYKKIIKEKEERKMTKTYNITGMKCQGCVNTVTEKLSAVKGVDKVQVDLENKQVTIEGKPWKWSLKRALKGTKFELGDEI